MQMQWHLHQKKFTQPFQNHLTPIGPDRLAFPEIVKIQKRLAFLDAWAFHAYRVLYIQLASNQKRSICRVPSNPKNQILRRRTFNFVENEFSACICMSTMHVVLAFEKMVWVLLGTLGRNAHE